MRRADRLFRIVQALRRRHVTTARVLATDLEVSERTIYRDVADLVAAGVPIRGEAGIGYALASGYDLPPLMFDVEEIEALVLGLRMVQAWCDQDLAKAATDVVAKVEQVLPHRLRDRLAGTALFVPDLGWTVPGSEAIADLRGAVRERRKAWIRYRDAEDKSTERVIHPLGLFFWGGVATLGAWCELRESFRSFRPDRIEAMRVLEEKYTPQSGQDLHDYFKTIAVEAARSLEEGR
jgi:predicted DNA-binding transcriptional regulator YafY